MSTEYLPVKPILCDQLWDAIETMGLWEAGEEEDDPGLGWITDGINSLEVHYCSSSGYATFTRYGGNDVDAILDAIAAHFETEIVGEHDDAFEDVFERHYAADYLTGSEGEPESP